MYNRKKKSQWMQHKKTRIIATKHEKKRIHIKMNDSFFQRIYCKYIQEKTASFFIDYCFYNRNTDFIYFLLISFRICRNS